MSGSGPAHTRREHDFRSLFNPTTAPRYVTTPTVKREVKLEVKPEREWGQDGTIFRFPSSSSSQSSRSPSLCSLPSPERRTVKRTQKRKAAPPHIPTKAVKQEPSTRPSPFASMFRCRAERVEEVIEIKEEEPRCHPCVAQYGWCPFPQCEWVATDAAVCALWLNRMCFFDSGSDAGVGPSYCSLRHSVEESTTPPRENLAVGVKSVVWCPRRHLLEEHLTPYSDYILARDASETGAKSFAILTRHLLAAVVLSTPEEQRWFYTVIPPATPVDIYIDVDLALGALGERIAEVEGRLGKGVAGLLVEAVVGAVVEEVRSGGAGLESFLVMDATTAVKVSYHVYAKLANGAAFANSDVLKTFVQNTQNRITQNPIYNNLFDTALDLSVYSAYSCFRLPFCTKMGRTNSFQVSSHKIEALKDLHFHPKNNEEILQYCRITAIGTDKCEKILNSWSIGGGGGGCAVPQDETVPQEGGSEMLELCSSFEREVFPLLPVMTPEGKERAVRKIEAIASRKWSDSYSAAIAAKDDTRSVVVSKDTEKGREFLRVPLTVAPLMPFFSATEICVSHSEDGVPFGGAPTDFYLQVPVMDVADLEGVCCEVLYLVLKKVNEVLKTFVEALLVLVQYHACEGLPQSSGVLRFHARLGGGRAFLDFASMQNFCKSIFSAELYGMSFAPEVLCTLPALPYSGPTPFVPLNYFAYSFVSAIPTEVLDMWREGLSCVEHLAFVSMINRPDVGSPNVFRVSPSGEVSGLLNRNERFLHGTAPAMQILGAVVRGQHGSDAHGVQNAATSTAVAVPAAEVRIALLAVLRSLSPHYSNVTSAGFTYTTTGREALAYTTKLTSSRHCLREDRSHKATFPTFLITKGGIYAKCFSNDCSAKGALRVEWPHDVVRHRATLFGG